MVIEATDGCGPGKMLTADDGSFISRLVGRSSGHSREAHVAREGWNPTSELRHDLRHVPVEGGILIIFESPL